MPGFSRKDVGRISRAVRHAERAGDKPRGGQSIKRLPNARGGLAFAKLTQDLTRNGRATATMWGVSSSPSTGGVGGTKSSNIDVFDAEGIPTGKKIASGVYVWITKYEGKWMVIQATACPVNV